MRYVQAILALGLLVVFHELGHLLAARLFGVRVLRFSLGFGPPLFRFLRKGTEWTVGAIPLGAFVRLHGMHPHQERLSPTDPTAFVSRRPWQRLLITLSGSVLNYLLALVVLVALYVSGTHVPVPMTIGAVEPGSPAARAQLRPGDVVRSVDGVPLERWSALVERVNDGAGRDLVLSIEREGRVMDVTVQPRADEHGVGRIGIQQQYVHRRHGVLEAVTLAFQHANRLVEDGVRLLWRLLRGARAIEPSSPIGLVRQASHAASSGFDAFLRVMVGISVVLAVFHLLPVPALDGGRALFIAFEMATGRRVNARLETALHALGFVALLAVVLAVASHELRRAFVPAEAPAAAPPDAGTEGPS